MIIDSFENWRLYPFGSAWNEAMEFLGSLSADSSAGQYPLRGDNMYAAISDYQSKPRDMALLETHRKYVDIQAVLSGSELVEIYAKRDLEIDIPYDATKDAEFYKHASSQNLIVLRPSKFILLFPHDAHMPSVMEGSAPESVKKVVIKISVESLIDK